MHLSEFHQPTSLPAALALLQRDCPHTVPLAGGTWLVPRLDKTENGSSIEAVVDLSHLGLNCITHSSGQLHLGAMATLADVIEDATCRQLANGILAQAARRDAVLNIRNAASVGGTVVVAPPDSVFVLALLALGAELDITSPQPDVCPLPDFLENRERRLGRGLVTRLSLPLPKRMGGGLAHLTRTPGDHPIVAAVAVVSAPPDGVHIAIGGATSQPALVKVDRPEAGPEAIQRALALAQAYNDFCGSAGYRREMGQVLAQRALDQAVANFKQA